MINKSRPLYYGFLKSSELYPERAALEVEGKILKYRELRNRATSIAATLTNRSKNDGPPLTAVFASRSIAAFSGILGVLFRGHGYVPLNHTLPVERNLYMLEKTGCHDLIIDSKSEEKLDKIIENISRPLLIILPECENVEKFRKQWPNHTFLGSNDLESHMAWEPKEISPDSIAYILFVSNNTGLPNGVMVSHKNVTFFIDIIVNRYGITETDRISLFPDIMWDSSVLDLFSAWEKGACVCCPSLKEVIIKPGSFISNMKLTFGHLFPSTAMTMKHLDMLKPNSYPLLRWTIFGCESLPMEVAKAWQEAAPNSIIENLYGITEMTVYCMSYRWDNLHSPKECNMDFVPIGKPFPGLKTIIVDEEFKEVSLAKAGELLVSGPQLSLGYCHDSEKTAKSFIIPAWKKDVFYKTGDWVRQSKKNAPFVFLGRKDDQVKYYGIRIDMGEIEAVLREEAGTDSVAAIGWPITPTGVGGIVAFLVAPKADTETIRIKVKERLPSYMVPRNYYKLSEFPLNPNGKLDRNALIKLMDKSE